MESEDMSNVQSELEKRMDERPSREALEEKHILNPTPNPAFQDHRLEKKIQQRPQQKELVDRNIMKQGGESNLESRRNSLGLKLENQPNREELEEKNILKPVMNPLFQNKRLEKMLKRRPKKKDLVDRNIMKQGGEAKNRESTKNLLADHIEQKRLVEDIVEETRTFDNPVFRKKKIAQLRHKEKKALKVRLQAAQELMLEEANKNTKKVKKSSRNRSSDANLALALVYMKEYPAIGSVIGAIFDVLLWREPQLSLMTLVPLCIMSIMLLVGPYFFGMYSILFATGVLGFYAYYLNFNHFSLGFIGYLALGYVFGHVTVVSLGILTIAAASAYAKYFME